MIRLPSLSVRFALLFVAVFPCAFLPAQSSHFDELYAQVNQLYSQGRYGEASDVALQAVSVAETDFGPDSVQLAKALNYLAVLYKQQGNYTQAESLYQRATNIDEKLAGPDHTDVAADLANLAALYHDQGKYSQAEPLFQRSLAILEKDLGADHLNVAIELTNLALLYEQEGKYSEAEPRYQRALSIFQRVLGPDSPSAAKTLNGLGQLYQREGRQAEAEPLFQRALAIDETALGTDHPDVAMSLNNLAELYVEQGKYADAEPLLQRTLRIDEKTRGPSHPYVALDLSNLAALYEDLGRYTDAEPLYQRALNIDESALGSDHPAVAAVLNNLALLYQKQGRYVDSDALYQRAIAILEKALGQDHPDVAHSLENLAINYSKERRYADAEMLSRRALRINEKAFGSSNLAVATDLINLGALYQKQGKYTDAESLDQRGLSIWENALGPEHPDVAGALENLAMLDDDQGKYSLATPLFERVFDNCLHQLQYNFTYLTEKQRLAFLATLYNEFPPFFSFVHRFHDKDPQLVGSMYNLLLWEKGTVAASITGMRRQIEASGDQKSIDLLNQLSAKRTQLAALLNVNPPDRSLWRKQIDQLRTEADEIEKSLVACSAPYAEKTKLDRATWQEVRDALAPREAAIEFARFRYYDKKWTDIYYYVALVVTRETKDQPKYIFLGDSAQIEGKTLAPFQQSLQTRGLSAEPAKVLPGEQAYSLIWRPLESALAGKTRINISPDGALIQIPFGIIPSPDGKLLLERYDLHLVSSSKDILRAAPVPALKVALLVGDPTFDLTDDQQRAALKKLSLPQPPANPQLPALSPNTLSRDAGNSSALPRLPGTGAEVNAIADLMHQHGWKTGVYLQDLALKRVVEQASAPRVVHLATHGFFLTDQQINSDDSALGTQSQALKDPMLRSGLYFAGADNALAGKVPPEGLDNGVLTAMEAGNLNLSGTELVVLSACNTGKGDVENGEGVFGLRRALQEAGAQSVLMSLWSVPDKETQELMHLFYTKWLTGTEMHMALTQAQLEMRRQIKREHNGRDLPYYWGAFILVGR